MSLTSRIIGLCLVGSQIFAVEKPTEKPPEKTTETKIEKTVEKGHQAIEEKVAEISKSAGETFDRRAAAEYFVLGTYSYIDLLIPGKMGATVGMIKHANQTWELEYLRGKLAVPFILKDLGEMTDERISIIGRSYFGSNSFNVSYGATHFNFAVHLGNELLNRLSGGVTPSVDLLEIEALGFNLALGNRWTFKKNFTVGIDWISWAQPLIITKRQSAFLDRASNSNDRDDVDRAMSVISYFPRLTVLKLQLGLLF